MPWKVAPMSEIRLAFVHHVLSLHHSVAEACRRFGISRKTGHKWLARHRTVISVTHRLESIAHADVIVVMRRGRVAEIGTHDQLMGAAGVYTRSRKCASRSKRTISSAARERKSPQTWSALMWTRSPRSFISTGG